MIRHDRRNRFPANLTARPCFFRLGRNLFPATGYLKLVWEALSHIYGRMGTDTRIIFENVKFKRACTMPHENNKLELTVMIQRVSGHFDVIESRKLRLWTAAMF